LKKRVRGVNLKKFQYEELERMILQKVEDGTLTKAEDAVKPQEFGFGMEMQPAFLS
jgi:hypothetical protein